MTDLSKHHATIFVPPEIAAPFENLRKTWDAAMAEQIAAHVTLVYPQEAPNVERLAGHLKQISGSTKPFRLRTGKSAYFESPEKGVYVKVEDIDGELSRLRRNLLQPPFAPIDFVPHITIIHPRTSIRGREFWEQSNQQLPETEFTVKEMTITAFDREKWQTISSFSLEQND